MVPVEQDVLGLQIHMYHLCASKENDKQARHMTLEHASTRYVYTNNDNNENGFQLMMS